MNFRQLNRVLVALVMLVPFAASAAAPYYSNPPGDFGPAVQISFTPNLTPIDFTVTPDATAIGPLGQPAADGGSQLTDEEDIELGLSGGNWEIGYDFVETHAGPQWHIWLDGEVIVVAPDDPLVTSLLNSFMIQADKRAQALRGLADAEEGISNSIIGGAGGLLGLVGGGVVGIISCAGVPFTFWAAGGTGWTCAGGIAASVGGAVTFGASVVQGFQSAGDKSQAQQDYADADREVRDLFSAIQEHAESSP